MNRFVRPFPEKENKEKETRYVHATKYALPALLNTCEHFGKNHEAWQKLRKIQF